MKTKLFWLLTCVAISVSVATVTTTAQGPLPTALQGTFLDFTPAANAPAGPYIITGTWSTKTDGSSGKADFSALLTMTRSDYWVLSTGSDPNNVALRGMHTHHVLLKDGAVTSIANGFRITGNAVFTGNGDANAASPLPITVDITGGNAVRFSNVSLTVGGGVSAHFGNQSIEGGVSPE
jgi:hypothetical protein